ncbi:MAG: glutamate racemase [Elusimicrobiota bacterium]|jgi:glutamate racemase|nr:glutamate racemase [Elusimicrobiota bacterium]
MNNNPIGIFDSGFGGLTVMSAVHKMFPCENLIYFGDSAHVPYGSKSPETVIRFSKDIAAFLASKKIKMLVIACNTATAHALPTIKKMLKIPVIGVIEPGSKAAIAATIANKIGVIGTQGTIDSNSYKKSINKISKSALVYQQACPLFVPIVEEGWTNTRIALETADIYLKPLINKKIDSLLLGCTHYPLLRKVLEKVIGKNIKIVDSANAVSCEIKRVLNEKNLFSNKKRAAILTFYTSDNPKKFQKLGGVFFGQKIPKPQKITLE